MIFDIYRPPLSRYGNARYGLTRASGGTFRINTAVMKVSTKHLHRFRQVDAKVRKHIQG